MKHILDNPIFNALTTGNRAISGGSAVVRHMHPEIGAFAGLKDNTEEQLLELYAVTGPGIPVVLFTPRAIRIPEVWTITLNKPLMQMVYEGSATDEPSADAVPLSAADIPAMLDLTGRTKPGPFLTRTIEFGHYEGIFRDGRLVAMAGQRLHPDPYTEISAVCTDPAYAGHGYAGTLVRNQVSRMVACGTIPFLHVLPENSSARSLYHKLGFFDRAEMMYYVLVKNPG